MDSKVMEIFAGNDSLPPKSAVVPAVFPVVARKRSKCLTHNRL